MYALPRALDADSLVQEKLLVEPSPDQMPDVLNDFDYDNVTAMEEIRSSEENKRKLQSKLQEVSLISPHSSDNRPIEVRNQPHIAASSRQEAPRAGSGYFI